MSIGVIDQLEVININHRQSRRSAVTLISHHLQLELLVVSPTVIGSGQGIDNNLLLDLFHLFFKDFNLFIGIIDLFPGLLHILHHLPGSSLQTFGLLQKQLANFLYFMQGLSLLQALDTIIQTAVKITTAE